jgi:glyoxylate/hydroxypyruvate reductase
MTNIFVWLNMGQEKKVLEEKVSEANLIYADVLNEAEQKEKFLQSEIAFGNVPSAWLKETSQLQWMQLESTGFGEYLWLNNSPLREKIIITNLKGMFGIPVAESAVAGILALYRGIDQLSLLKLANEWMDSSLRPYLSTLHRRKVLIAGGGAIGLHIKQILTGFQCQVTVMGKSSGGADIYSAKEFDALLPETDIVVSALPETEETINFFSKERLTLLKTGAVFVNVGRGSVVDENALAEALQTGKLGGSVLDVTVKEPLPVDHPFWNCPNTILTQHTGGGSDDELLQKVYVFLDNLERYQKGKTLKNIINLEKGY